jgi:hypothetical protein
MSDLAGHVNAEASELAELSGESGRRNGTSESPPDSSFPKASRHDRWRVPQRGQFAIPASARVAAGWPSGLIPRNSQCATIKVSR